MDQHQHGHSAGHGGCCGSKPAEAVAETRATNPVCGMKVDPATSRRRYEHAGATYHFCSAGCRTKFEADPAKYLAPKTEPPVLAPAQGGTTYTCPMQPQIRQKGPGSCLICGMALEPEEITAESAPSHELTDITRRFSVGMVLALPVFILEMDGHIPALELHRLVPLQTSIWVQSALSAPVVL
jgi:Cu+-exporting ATPase